MEKQLRNNGQVLMEVHNLVHLRNQAGVQQVFEVVEIDHGYVILEPLDARKFGGAVDRINAYLTGKTIVKGVITHSKQ